MNDNKYPYLEKDYNKFEILNYEKIIPNFIENSSQSDS